MKIRFIVLVLLVATACQTGKIPCPRIKYVKAKRTIIRKNFQQSEQSMQARAAADRVDEDKAQARVVRGTDEKMVHNVSMEEWDCPRPGAKKYMPRSVRDNIKKNRKRLEQADTEAHQDSVMGNK